MRTKVGFGSGTPRFPSKTNKKIDDDNSTTKIPDAPVKSKNKDTNNKNINDDNNSTFTWNNNDTLSTNNNNIDWTFNSTSFNTNSNNNGNSFFTNNNNNNISTNISGKTKFSQLPNSIKQTLSDFENKIIQRTENNKNSISKILSILQNKDDISTKLDKAQHDTELLKDNIYNQQYDLKKFKTKMTKELVCVSQLSCDMNSIHCIIKLPPTYYADKLLQFHHQIKDMKTALHDIKNHLHEIQNGKENNARSVTIKALQQTYKTLIQITSKVLNTHKMVESLKDKYKSLTHTNFTNNDININYLTSNINSMGIHYL